VLVEPEVLLASLNPIMNAIDLAVGIVDLAGVVVEWNAAAERLYGIARADIVGKPITAFFDPASLMVSRVLETGEAIASKYAQPRPGIHVLVTASPVMCGGRLVGAVAVERDVTRMVELSAELLRARDQVAALEKQLTVRVASPGADGDHFQAIKGCHPVLQQAIALARRVAPTEATIIIRGESGVGKELFAQAIHRASRRRNGPFVALNCAAIPATLFESELFGYAPGAFTGASPKGHPGKLELAEGGTLFLDEVGELPLESQVKLLRFLQDRSFYRVGGSSPVAVDVRIVAATNQHLENMVQSKRFRDDLYWRLNVVTLDLPPLRERKEDIPELVQVYIHEFNLQHGRSVAQLHPAVVQALMGHPWPGNVRELRNTVERMVVLAPGRVVGPDLLPNALRPLVPALMPSLEPGLEPAPEPAPEPADTAAQEQEHGEREAILAALIAAGNNRTKAARLLGVSRGTLYNRSRRAGIPL
jgi:sigma-54 dependent transcriptional regulator, acetoin dehydrogenase operon transcriptional activator AcoR